MSKEAYIAAHEEAIADYLDANPDADEAKAYERTADEAYGRMIDRYAAMADYCRDLKKEGLL